MTIVSAENNFRRGLEAFVDQNFVEAVTYFRRAMDVEHQRRVVRPDMRYLSYYGICRAKGHGKVQEGLHACRRAARMRPNDPEMFLNLGRVHLLAQQHRSALEAFRRGLEIEPDHTVLRVEFARVEQRLPARAAAARKDGFFARMRSAWTRPVQTHH